MRALVRAIYGVEPSRRRRAVEAPIFVELDAGLMRRIIVTPSGDVEASSLCIEASSLCIEERRTCVEPLRRGRRAFTSRRRGQGSAWGFSSPQGPPLPPGTRKLPRPGYRPWRTGASSPFIPNSYLNSYIAIYRNKYRTVGI